MKQIVINGQEYVPAGERGKRTDPSRYLVLRPRNLTSRRDFFKAALIVPATLFELVAGDEPERSSSEG